MAGGLEVTNAGCWCRLIAALCLHSDKCAGRTRHWYHSARPQAGGVLRPAILLTIQMRIVVFYLKLHVFGSNGECILQGLLCNVDISRSMWQCSNKNAHFPSFKISLYIGNWGSGLWANKPSMQSAICPPYTMQCIGWWREQDSQDNVISAPDKWIQRINCSPHTQ